MSWLLKCRGLTSVFIICRLSAKHVIQGMNTSTSQKQELQFRSSLKCQKWWNENLKEKLENIFEYLSLLKIYNISRRFETFID